MKNILALFLILTIQLFSQSWNSTVTTTINEPNLVKMDLFTNKDGNHIIVQNSNSTNSIKYYLLNSSGTVVRSSTIETSGSAEFPNISGDNEKVYLVYKLGSNLEARKSTDAGQNWSTIDDKAIGSNTCNGVDIIYDYLGLHVVYAMKDSDPNYETYYYKINSSNSWVDYKNVTDYDANEVGGFPTVTTSTDRVHVSYNTGTSSDPTGNEGEAKTRDKYSSTWQTPQLVFGGDDGNSGSERAFSDNTSLFDFYYEMIEGMGQWHFDLYTKKRTVGGTTWSSPTLLDEAANPANLVSTAKTNNGNTHVVYKYVNGASNTINHKSFDGSNWSDGYGIASGASYYKGPSLSTVSNDLFIILKESSSDYVKYRQYDALPLAPTNPQLSSNPGNGMVRFTWAMNNEPDISLYEVWRKVAELGGTWQSIGTTSNTYFVDPTYYYAPGAGDFNVTYKVRAKDVGNNYSAFSSEVSTRAEEIGKKSVIANSQIDFELQQNYPNPFNPTTKISYSIKEEGLVTLKIYDILGNEVAELVNDQKEPGYYEVEFDASKLSSGIYLYKIEAGNYIATKKLILMK